MTLDPDALWLSFGLEIASAPVTVRRLDEVGPLLRGPGAAGPEHLYAISLDPSPGQGRATCRVRRAPTSAT